MRGKPRWAWITIAAVALATAGGVVWGAATGPKPLRAGREWLRAHAGGITMVQQRRSGLANGWGSESFIKDPPLRAYSEGYLMTALALEYEVESLLFWEESSFWRPAPKFDELAEDALKLRESPYTYFRLSGLAEDIAARKGDNAMRDRARAYWARAMETAPCVLVQRYLGPAGDPAGGLSIECRVSAGCVSNGVLRSRGLGFDRVSTDDDGFIYLPVPDVLLKFAAWPEMGEESVWSGMLTLSSLDWFTCDQRVARLPDVTLEMPPRVLELSPTARFTVDQATPCPRAGAARISPNETAVASFMYSPEEQDGPRDLVEFLDMGWGVEHSGIVSPYRLRTEFMAEEGASVLYRVTIDRDAAADDGPPRYERVFDEVIRYGGGRLPVVEFSGMSVTFQEGTGAPIMGFGMSGMGPFGQ